MVFITIERLTEYEKTLHSRREAFEVNWQYRPPGKASKTSTYSSCSSWPSQGRIRIHNLALRYRGDLELVLDGISFEIGAGEKVGICGRTGAGKSSLLKALFRLVEPERGSEIEIDGVDCLKLGLRDLRGALSIIPQEPVLFSGTLKFNLDPFGQKSDDELWRMLRKCELFEWVSAQEEKLLFRVTEGGNNLSAGQRQLVCIGRALLNRSKVLALDEATSSIDQHTDSLIQTLIRTELADATVLCIAHPLQTIRDYDKILVLDAGKIVEYDTPENLLKGEGLFYKMMHQRARRLVDE